MTANPSSENQNAAASTQDVRGSGLSVASGSGSWTPLHIELMIHYCCSCSHFPRADAPAVIDYTRQLIECGLVEETADDPRRNYRATPMGEAFLELVCRTPLPRLAWVAPTGEVIAYSPNS
jgi:hypothetical protein